MFKKEKLILEMAQFPDKVIGMKRYQSPDFNKTKRRIKLKIKSLKRVLMPRS